MKKTALMTFALLAFHGAALADDNFHPDCKIAGIEQSLQAAETEIKSSPAFGHAGGHYAKALQAIQGAKRQLRAGCGAWMKSEKK